MSARLDGWEARLNEQIRLAAGRDFDLLHWNCALFAAACVEAITGQEIPRRIVGTLEQTVDGLFPRVPQRLALRGDLVLARLPEPVLGVCTGTRAAFLKASGLTFIPMRRVVVAWRV